MCRLKRHNVVNFVVKRDGQKADLRAYHVLMKNLWLVLGVVGCIVACQLAGAIGVLTSPTGNSPWYRALAKPAFNPPGWIFGPVWTILYTMMGVSLWLLLRVGWGEAKWAILLFVAQLLLNALWTPVFFRWHEIGWALAVVVAMELLIVATIAAAWPVSRPAGVLLLPYAMWVGFASVLNAAIWRLN